MERITVFLSVTLLTKSMKFGSTYLTHRLSELDTLIDWDLLYINSKTGELWPKVFPGVPKFTSV